MENALAPTEGTAAVALPDIHALQQASPYSDRSNFVEVAGPGFGTFLPYLQLFGSNSDMVKEGKLPVAVYAFVEGKEKTLTQVGKTVQVCPIGWRAKAMFFKTADGKPIAFHNPKSAEFMKIKAAGKADSNSGNMFGPEFLLWVPQYKKFMTFFMGSETARNAAAPVHALLPRPGGGLKAGILASVLIDNGTHKWHGPTIALSDASFESPDSAELLKTLQDFLNPRDSEIQEAAPEGAANSDR